MENNIGRKTTLWELLKDTKIEIPIIQRDYAQGREDKAPLREKFLEHLLGALKDDSDGIVLDFVYGTEIGINSDKKLNPLDGQQRLTTLFLLHWYLAWKLGKLKDKNTENTEESKRLLNFTYETRVSSRVFCEALVEEGIVIEDVKELLSKHIENQSWFFKEYLQDPTISSMLRMLDDIDKALKDTEIENIWKNLTEKKNEKITFFYLDLKGFKQTDDLYVKMNARGKALTPFENFKADLENHIRSLTENNSNFSYAEKIEKYFEAFNYINDVDKTFSRYVEYKFDKEYLDFFWHYTKPTSDDIKNNEEPKTSELFMNFIHTVIINEALANYDGNNQNFLNEIGDLRDLTETTFSKFKSVFSKYNENLLNLVIAKLIESLDCLDVEKKISKEYRFYFKEEEYFRKVLIFKKDKKDKITYYNRLLLFAYLRYLMKFGKEGLSDWMRVMRNLILNKQYNNVSDFYNSIKSISKIIDSLKKEFSLEGFKDLDSEWKFFDPSQLNEEIVKAELILDPKLNCKNEIIEAEKLNFFKGQIGVMLILSKDSNGICTDSFCKYRDKLAGIFENSNQDIEGNLEENSDVKRNFEWEMAVLSKGMYFYQKNHTRYNIFSGSTTHRDFSWRASFYSLLKNKVIPSLEEKTRKDNPELQRIYCIKKVLDDLINDNNNTLGLIINSPELDNVEIGDISIPYEYYKNELLFELSRKGFIDIPVDSKLSPIILASTHNCVRYELSTLYLCNKCKGLGDIKIWDQLKTPIFDIQEEDKEYKSAFYLNVNNYEIWVRSNKFNDKKEILGNIFIFKRDTDNGKYITTCNMFNSDYWELVRYANDNEVEILKYTGILTVEYIEKTIDELKGIVNENISNIEA